MLALTFKIKDKTTNLQFEMLLFIPFQLSEYGPFAEKNYFPTFGGIKMLS